jgi:iron complex outermembrane receptor protein
MTNTLALTYKLWDPDANDYRPNTIGLRGAPRLTSVFSANWRKGDFSTTLRVNRTSETQLNYDETDVNTWSETACLARIKPAAGSEIPCYRRADLRTDLNFVYTGFKNMRLSLNIRNALLQSAPYDLRGGYALRPRSFKLGAEYEF